MEELVLFHIDTERKYVRDNKYMLSRTHTASQTCA